jgi:outer membrane receptor protein involved in Fe transport
LNNGVAVTDYFTELRVPLVQNVRFAHELMFDAGFRRSDYTTSGAADTYKLELQFSPVADYRLRGSFAKAIRAPSALELFNPQNVVTLNLGDDPCAPTFKADGSLAAPASFTLAQCQRMGVTAAQYGNGSTTDTIPQGTAQQLSGLQGGNPHLKPEQSTTYTIGVNFAPSQVPNLSGSIDYYHIALTGLVETIPSSVIFNGCGLNNDAYYCSQIFRNPVTGGLTTIGPPSGGGYLVQTDVNAGAALVSGVDFQLHYKQGLPGNLGSVLMDLNSAYLEHFTTTPVPGGHTYDCAGLFGLTCETVNPRWHHILRATWETPWNLTGSVTWRYFGAVSEDNNSSDPSLHGSTYGGGYDYFNAKIPAFNYLDLQVAWHPWKFLTLRAGVNNLLDKDPPIVNSTVVPGGEANTIDVYDMFGRQLYISFTARM